MPTFDRWLVALLFVSSVEACDLGPSGRGDPSGHATVDAHVDGKFASYLLSPRGDIDGMLLEDDTVVRFPPHTLLAHADQVKAGDQVVVSGDELKSAFGKTIVRASVSKWNVTLVRAEAAPSPPPLPGRGEDASDELAPPPAPPRPPGLAPPDGPAQGGEAPAEVELSAMTLKGVVKALSTNPEGRVDCIVLGDGSSGRMGPRARLETMGLKVGDTITLLGRGGSYPLGKSIEIESIELTNGHVESIEGPGREGAIHDPVKALVGAP